MPPGPPLQRALLESAQDVPSQRGAWQAAPCAWDGRRRLFHGLCGACGEESWDLQQMQLQRVTVLYRQKAGHGVVFFRVLYTMTIYTFRILACS